MPEISHEFRVKRGIDNVWRFAGDIGNFANCMPGLKQFEALDEHHSFWVISFSLGPLQKTLEFDVTVTDLEPGQRLRFELVARNDPVRGHGEFETTPVADDETKIQVALAITGSGPMAPMMEAMARPFMPKLARDFSNALAKALEASS